MAVVKQTQHIFDLTDVLAIRLQCGHCKAEVVNPQSGYRMPGECPLCGEPWDTDLPDGSMGPNRLLTRAIQDVLRHENLPVTVRFEIDGDQDERMTLFKQTRVTFDIGDILSFKVCCSSCKAEITAELEKLRSLIQCPLCGENWEHPNETSAVREALRALRNLSRDKEPTRTIRFEIDGSESPD